VEIAARAVLAVSDTPTTVEQQQDRLMELGLAMANLREALGGVHG
jgi:hypothetical protein